MKPVNRRSFLISSIKGAAGLGIMAGCNSRNIVGEDIRDPSSPKGLSKKVLYNNGNYTVVISWDRHDLTDITGARTEEQIVGYNLFRDQEKLNSTPITDTTFTDTYDFQVGNSYVYECTAIDQNGNESPYSSPRTVKIIPPGPVYICTNDSALSGNVINLDVVKDMLHSTVMAMTGRATVSEAYESLFPVLNESTIIAIKINTLAGTGLCTHPEVVEAVVDGLKSMLAGTFPEYNIIVFDDRRRELGLMASAGFPLRDETGKYRIVTTAGNWGSTTYDISGVPQKLSRIVEETADYIINVPVLKDHNRAGVTFSLKNLYGIVSNPAGLHDNMCNPFIPEIYSQNIFNDIGRPLRDKIRLTVGDAILGAYVGGPQTAAQFTPCTLALGTDPVALDAWARDVINEKRKEMSVAPISEEATIHIDTASEEPYLLGSPNYDIYTV